MLRVFNRSKNKSRMKIYICILIFCVLVTILISTNNVEGSNMDKLHWLKGTWKSISAQGIYPTITSFNYIETLLITQPKNKPYFNYVSNTINNEKVRQPMHCEFGFLRLLGNNSVCLQLAHNFGINTIEKGVYNEKNGNEFQLESTSIVRAVENPDSNKAKVVKLRRYFKLNNNNQLQQIVEMETDKTEMTNHLTVTYEKIGGDGYISS